MKTASYRTNAAMLLALAAFCLEVHAKAAAENPAEAETPAIAGKSRSDAPLLRLAEVTAYEPDKSITLKVTLDGRLPVQRTFEYTLTKDKTEIRVIGDAQDIAVGMQVMVWANLDNPRSATRIVAHPKTPTVQGVVTDYEEGKSITLEVKTDAGMKRQAFGIAPEATEFRMMKGRTIKVGMRVSLWTDKKAPDTAALIDIKGFAVPVAGAVITRERAIAIARRDLQRLFPDLTKFRVTATLENDGWHVEFAGALFGYGYYVISASTGKILSKRWGK